LTIGESPGDVHNEAAAVDYLVGRVEKGEVGQGPSFQIVEVKHSGKESGNE
jgi:hypothetical protein